MIVNELFGSVSGAEDVSPFVSAEEDDRAGGAGTAGDALWSYHGEGRINGVPVAAGDLDLKIDDESVLGSAFVLRRTLRSMMLYLSPDDKASSDRYDALLDRVNDGSVEIVDEVRQWDQEHSRFVMWVRYNELEYRLHPRFAYLREE